MQKEQFWCGGQEKRGSRLVVATETSLNEWIPFGLGFDFSSRRIVVIANEIIYKISQKNSRDTVVRDSDTATLLTKFFNQI